MQIMIQLKCRQKTYELILLKSKIKFIENTNKKYSIKSWKIIYFDVMHRTNDLFIL